MTGIRSSFNFRSLELDYLLWRQRVGVYACFKGLAEIIMWVVHATAFTRSAVSD